MSSIYSSDNAVFVDIGTEDTWKAVRSTVIVRLGSFKKNVPLAIKFLISGSCDHTDAMETARQINMIRDKLSQFPPEQAVYDMDAPDKKAPWENNLSPVITSCANLFTTADGKDLFYELVSILVYASIMETSVSF